MTNKRNSAKVRGSHARPSIQDGGSAGGVMITRRQLLAGAAGVAAVAAVGGVAAMAMSRGSAQDGGIGGGEGGSSTLSVANEAVFTTDNCEYIEDASSVMKMAASAALPYGTLVWADDDDVAICILPTETGKPLVEIGLVELGSGNMNKILEHAVGENEGFEVFDARATKSGMVWTEADILDNHWKVYTANLSGKSLGDAVVVAEGDSNWEMPALAVCGSKAFWQLLPNLNGDFATEDSKLMSASFGDVGSVQELYISRGRMACAPSGTASGVAFAPRADTSGTVYQLTHIDSETGQITDALTLPSGMKPSDISYGSTGFSFCFSGIYDYGKGISNLGTYTAAYAPAYDFAKAQEDAVAGIMASKSSSSNGSDLTEAESKQADTRAAESVAQLYSSAEWFRFPRSPVTTPAWCGNWFLVKSANSVAGVNMNERRYFTFDVEDGAPNYGEFLASSGQCSRIVTYTNIDYTPLTGTNTKECRVKIWQPV